MPLQDFSIVLFSELYISKYEAYLTETPLQDWNKNLPNLSIVCQIMISMFLISTEISIKVLFKCRAKQQGKPRIKNTISFKSLNILYSIGMILEAILHILLMQINSKDTFILNYDIPLVLNLMLLTFLVSNEDAMKFCFVKFSSWKERQMFRFQVFRWIRNRNQVGQMQNIQHARENIPLQPINRNLFVIELE